jgi:uncharacterized membrane protein YfcA
MIEIFLICIAALITSLLTFFSGFGLGTILTPVFAIFFPIELAIALTGIVHFFNNVLKLILVGRNADKGVILRFGLPAVVASFAGAWLLLNVSELPPLFTYAIGTKTFVVTPVKFIIGILLTGFAILDLIPFFDNIKISKNKLPLGGILSGFFGGLSGNQGALRSAFLIKAGLSKESFIATTIVISCLVDFTRLSVYATRFLDTGLMDNVTLVVSATLSAFAGAYIGSKLLKKVTLQFIQKLVAVLLVMISIALAFGVI